MMPILEFSDLKFPELETWELGYRPILGYTTGGY